MIHYEIQGDRSSGRPLLLLHGFLESSTMWSALNLEGCQILVDLPGHGQSGDAPITSMRAMAEEVQRVLQHEGIDDYDVIGHSMGGYVALELVDLDPNAATLILLNSNMWEDPPEKKRDRARVADLVQTKKEMFVHEVIPNLFQSPEEFREDVDALIEEALQISAKAIGDASMAMSRRRSFESEVKSGAFPVYVIQGKNDAIASEERMRDVMEAQSERMFVVPSGHMAHFEAKARVEEIIRTIRT